mgnify:CR=1 FL=1
MSDTTARLARQWAEKYLRYADESDSSELYAAAQIVKANTTPPTMDEVEWDEDKHALTGAVVDVGGGPIDVVMLAGSVAGIDYATLDGKFGYEPRYYFTPNGKRYELREVGAPEEPEHPETLTTEQDYEDAPEGTVVAKPGCLAWTKSYGGDWDDEGGGKASHEMAGTEREVLRWRWGKMIAPDKARGMLHYAGGDGFTSPELCLTAELAAHAPVMAEQIANMHYEYAVQVDLPDGKMYVNEDPEGGAYYATSIPSAADWAECRDYAEDHAEEAAKYFGKTTRVVCRLVSTPEVAE